MIIKEMINNLRSNLERIDDILIKGQINGILTVLEEMLAVCDTSKLSSTSPKPCAHCGSDEIALS
jgi:hypothetical protein